MNRRLVSRTREVMVLAGLLLVFGATCLRYAWTTSPTFDEPGLIYSGYANLTPNSAKTFTGNLLFAQTWAALPLLLTRPVLPSQDDILAVDPINREFGRIFLFHPKNHWAEILRPARAMNILLGMILGLVIYRWSKNLFGEAGGFVSLAFYCLSPTILANAPLATTDVATALGFALAVERWWVLLHRVRVGNIIACGAATGLLLITKFSSFALAPMIICLVGCRLAYRQEVTTTWRRHRFTVAPGWRQLRLFVLAGAAALVVSIAVIWIGYLLPMTVFASEGSVIPWESMPHYGVAGRLTDWLHHLGIVPDPYLRDLQWFNASASGRRAYLMGNYSISGWWYFFPVAWWFKTPIPFVIVLALATVAVIRRRDARWMAPLAVLVLVYAGISLFSGLNIGIRHWMPLFPALFVFAGAVVLLDWRPRVWRGVIVLLLGWSVAEVASTKGQYLAYFNQFGGGPKNGHLKLVDSSYEWGQDLLAVEKWLAERRSREGGDRPVYFSYFGNADLSRFAIDAALLPQFFELRPIKNYEMRPGTYLISATMLHNAYGLLFGPWRASYENLYRALLAQSPEIQKGLPAREQEARLQLIDALRFGRLCSYLRKREPDSRITFGVLVYELTQQDLEFALLRPVAEGSADYQVPGTERLPQSNLEFLK